MFIDGNYFLQASSTLKNQVRQVAESGVPVFIFGGQPTSLTSTLGSIPYALVSTETLGGANTAISNEAFGFYINPHHLVGGKPFVTQFTLTGGDLSTAMSMAHSWALNQKASSSATTSILCCSGGGGGGAYWNQDGFSFTWYMNECPHGWQNIVDTFYTLVNGPSGQTYKTEEIQQQGLPGNSASANCGNTNWYNWNWETSIYVNAIQSGVTLNQYEPTSSFTQGTTTLTITTAAIGISWSFPNGDNTPQDQSNFGTQLAQWQMQTDCHSGCNGPSSMMSNTFNFQPGLEIYIASSGASWNTQQNYDLTWVNGAGWCGWWCGGGSTFTIAGQANMYGV